MIKLLASIGNTVSILLLVEYAMLSAFQAQKLSHSHELLIRLVVLLEASTSMLPGLRIHAHTVAGLADELHMLS